MPLVCLFNCFNILVICLIIVGWLVVHWLGNWLVVCLNLDLRGTSSFCQIYFLREWERSRNPSRQRGQLEGVEKPLGNGT